MVTYAPGNVHWALPKEQSRNRRDNRVLVFQGESRCLQEWAEQMGLDPRTLTKRLSSGWSVDRALSTPVNLACRNTRAKQAGVQA